MFEKEAENYADEQIGCGDGYYEWTDVKQSFKDGAEFGYNKANEWHYVKDGKAQIEKMKCCFNCRHSRTEYEHCRTDKHEKWEIKEND